MTLFDALIFLGCCWIVGFCGAKAANHLRKIRVSREALKLYDEGKRVLALDENERKFLYRVLNQHILASNMALSGAVTDHDKLKYGADVLRAAYIVIEAGGTPLDYERAKTIVEAITETRS